jgi:hypothetical protein
MACVYLDSTVLFLHLGRAGEAVISPDAKAAVELLEQDGHQVFVVGPTATDADGWAARLPRVVEPMPVGSDGPAAWLIVGDRDMCGSRSARLRTVLVGGGPLPYAGGHRCDTEVADLHAAVMAVVEGASIA